MIELKILVEKSKGGFVATVRDEYGEVCSSAHPVRDQAVLRAIKKAKEQIDGELSFTVEDMVS
jgi:hypothetical protein